MKGGFRGLINQIGMLVSVQRKPLQCLSANFSVVSRKKDDK